MANLSQNKRKIEDDIEIQTCEKSNTLLSYDILRVIFKNLDYKDLTSASLVCRSWYEAANNEKRIRGPYCFLRRQNQQIGLCTNKRILKLDFLKVKPSLAFIFSAAAPCGHECSTTKETYEFFPTHCEVIMLHTSGVIINSKEIEGQLQGISRVFSFIPQVPHITVRRFYQTAHTNKVLTTMKSIFISSQIDDKLCLILFCNNSGYGDATRIIQYLKLSGHQDKIDSVWGGVVPNMLICNLNNKESRMQKPTCIGVLISGDVKTWSIVIDKNYVTKEQIEERLKSLKDQIELRKYSMGFMFACQARGQQRFREKNVESSIFKKLFPKIPLVGCFGEGEFGKNTLIYKDVIENSKSNNLVSHQFSTVFLILTYDY